MYCFHNATKYKLEEKMQKIFLNEPFQKMFFPMAIPPMESILISLLY